MVDWLAGKRVRGTSSERTPLGVTLGGTGVGGWVELGRTTLGSASETLEVTDFADKRYLMFLIDGKPVSSEFQTVLQTGNSSFDTGSNYASRSSENGGADGTNTSFPYNQLSPSTSLSELFAVGYWANYASKEKLVQVWATKRETAGAANAPSRKESVGKWANTSNVIDRLRVNENGSGTINTNSEMVVLGWDPADTHTNNFWEELASVDLGSDGDNLSSGTITAKKYLWVQYWLDISGSNQANITFNNDTGTNYAYRRSEDGGADATTTSVANIRQHNSASSVYRFGNLFIVNNASNEKLVTSDVLEVVTTGAATAPQRMEVVGKWDNTSNQITEIDIDNPNAGDFLTGSKLRVWGAD